MLILSCGMLEQCIPAAESYVAIVHVKEGWGEREKDGMDRGGREGVRPG